MKSRSVLHPLLNAAVSLIESPAAVVADGEDVIVFNGRWRRSTRCAKESDGRLPLERSLKDFSHVDALVAKLKSRPRGAGIAITRHDAGESATDELWNEYAVRWRQIQIPSQQHSLAFVTLRAIPEANRSTPIEDPQQARIDRLLGRQTLIEESERRQLGRALHDVVVQDLTQIRSTVRSSGIPAAEQSDAA